MSTSLPIKFKILYKVIKLLKNWYLFVALYFHLVSNDVIFETRNGIKIKMRAKSTDLMAFTNVWVLCEYYKPAFEIRDNDTIIDIGAHVGFFALYASQYCKSGQIFCFEPVKDNFDLLVENIRINNLTNVNCFNNAISDANKIVRVYINEADKAAHSIHVDGKEYVDISAKSLSCIIDENNIKVCDLLKLDCEGSEYEILNSTPDEYIQKIQKICLEYHILKNNHESLFILKNRLASMNFEITDKSTTTILGMLYARK